MKIFERTYGGDLSLGGAVEYFSDNLVGSELNTIISSEVVSKFSQLNGIFEGKWVLGTGMKLDVEIGPSTKDEIETEESKYEWLCIAYETK